MCQASVAHFTRIGYALTPAKTASFPRASGSGRAFSPVTTWWNAWKRSWASSTVLPMSTSVRVEAEAVEMAQPEPWKPMSSMRPPSPTRSLRVSRSPHRAL